MEYVIGKNDILWNETSNKTDIVTFPPVVIQPGYAYRTFGDTYKFIYIIISCLIAVFSITGNIFLSATIISKRKLRTPTNLLLLSLVAADLLTAVVFIPIYLERFLHQNVDHTDRELCLLRKYLYITTSSGSLVSLAVVSFDRMLAISSGFFYERWMTKRVAWCTITIIWVWTIGFNSITFNGFIDWGKTLDTCLGGIPTVLFFIVTPIGFYLPGIVIIAAYIKIYLVARGVNKRIQSSKVSCSTINMCLNDIPSSSSVCLPVVPSLNIEYSTKRRRSSLPDLRSTANNSPIDIRRERSATTLTVLNSPLLSIKKSRSATIISQTLQEGKEKIRKAKRSITRDIRTVKTIAMLVGICIVSWLPTAGFNMYINIYGLESYKSQGLLLHHEIFTLLSFLNCALDPYVYTYRSRELRKASSKTLRNFLKTLKREN